MVRGVQDVLRDGLNAMRRDAANLAPVDDGDLRDSIDVKLSKDKLTGIVGPGVNAAEIVRKKTGSIFGQIQRNGKKKGQVIKLSKRNVHAYFQLLKGYWKEFGTKGSPASNIPPQPATPFMRPAYDRNRHGLQRRLRASVDKALKRAANG